MDSPAAGVHAARRLRPLTSPLFWPGPLGGSTLHGFTPPKGWSAQTPLECNAVCWRAWWPMEIETRSFQMFGYVS
jgi:hypothetical protein